jgi:hypothetical protein
MTIVGESLSLKRWWPCSTINGVVCDYRTLNLFVSLAIMLMLTLSLRPNAISENIKISITKLFRQDMHKIFSVQFTALNDVIYFLTRNYGTFRI